MGFSSTGQFAPSGMGRILCDERPTRITLAGGWTPDITRPPVVELRHDGRVYMSGRAIPPGGGIAAGDLVGFLPYGSYRTTVDLTALGLLVYESGVNTCKIRLGLSDTLIRVHSVAGAVPHIDFDWPDEVDASWVAQGLDGNFGP